MGPQCPPPRAVRPATAISHTRAEDIRGFRSGESHQEKRPVSESWAHPLKEMAHPQPTTVSQSLSSTRSQHFQSASLLFRYELGSDSRGRPCPEKQPLEQEERCEGSEKTGGTPTRMRSYCFHYPKDDHHKGHLGSLW